MRCLFQSNQPIGSYYSTVTLYSATLFGFFSPNVFWTALCAQKFYSEGINTLSNYCFSTSVQGREEK